MTKPFPVLVMVMLLSVAFAITPNGARAGAPPTDPFLEVNSFAPATAPPAPERIRLASYNLHGPPTERIADITDVLAHHPAFTGAAVMGLQEVNRHYQYTGYKDMARLLASTLGVYYAYGSENAYRKGGGERGLAIFSRFPLSEVERVVLPHPGPNGRRRITVGATVHLGRRKLRVYTLHLETRLSVEERGGQIAAILKQAERYRDLPTVVLGDFNTVTGGATKKMVELMEAAGFQSTLPGDTMTFQRALFVRLKLDWIWVRNLRVVASGVENDITASDHRPIWVEVEWPMAVH